MPNRPQDPPEGSYSLHMAPGISRPTSPPPPRKKGQVDPLESAYAMIRDLREAVKTGDNWLKRSRETNERLCGEIKELKVKLGKYECPNCGESDREENRQIHPVSADPVCYQCGGLWD